MDQSKKRALLVTAIVFFQLLAVYVLVQGLQKSMTRQFTSNAEVTLDKLADDIAYRSEKFLKPVEGAVRIGVALLAEDLLDITDDRELELFFQSHLNNIAWLSGMFLGRPDGSFVFVARNRYGLRSKLIKIEDGVRSVEIIQRDAEGTTLETWIDTEDEYDPRTRVWYTNAMNAPSTVWTEPYSFFSTGLPGMSVSAKSIDGSILGADVNIRELSDFTASIPNSRNGTAVIVDDTRHVIAYANDNIIAADTESSGVPSVDDIIDPALETLYQLIVRDDLLPSTSQQQIINTEVEGRGHLGLVRSFSLLDDNLKWTLLAQVPADDYAGGALSLLDQRTQTFGMLTLSLGVLTLFGVAGIHWAARPSPSASSSTCQTHTLKQAEFETRLDEYAARQASEMTQTHRAVMVIEYQNLRYLADRSCRNLESDVLSTQTIVIRDYLGPDEFLACADHDRMLVSMSGISRNEVHQRIKQLHEIVAETAVIDMPDGQKALQIASGAAFQEPEAPLSNLLLRAREALSTGIRQSATDCYVAESFFSGPDIDVYRAA